MSPFSPVGSQGSIGDAYSHGSWSQPKGRTPSGLLGGMASLSMFPGLDKPAAPMGDSMAAEQFSLESAMDQIESILSLFSTLLQLFKGLAQLGQTGSQSAGSQCSAGRSQGNTQNTPPGPAPNSSPAITSNASDRPANGSRHVTQDTGDLFLKGANDKSAISANDIKQGSIGDCYFLASLATLADQHPEIIENNISKMDDGTYNVTFYDQAGNPLEMNVSEADFINNGAHDADRKNGKEETWVKVYEAAYKKMVGYGDLANGGTPEEAMQFLTGKSSEHYNASNTSAIENALKQGKMVEVATPNNANMSQYGLVPWHVYSVRAIDNDTVTLYNPWGEEVKLSRSQFADAFGGQGVSVFA